MKKINTIDLWTEQNNNHHECFNACFIDGLESSTQPFTNYTIIKNCNCQITCNNNKIRINNKHNAIVFYNNNKPVRLLVISKDTDIEKCVNIALNQYYKQHTVRDIYDTLNITTKTINLKQKSVDKEILYTNEMDVGSCDRWKLLYNMLKGSYTEDDTIYGNFSSCKYEFVPNIEIRYNLKTKDEHFDILHKCAFINDTFDRIVPIQENSDLTK